MKKRRRKRGRKQPEDRENAIGTYLGEGSRTKYPELWSVGISTLSTYLEVGSREAEGIE